MESIDFVKALRRRWPIALGLLLMATSAAFVSAPTKHAVPQRRFAATQSLILHSDAGSQGGASIVTVAFYATNGEVPRRAAVRLGRPGQENTVASQVSASADTALGVVKISSTQSSPARATEYVDVFSNELVRYLDEQETARRQKNVDLASARMTDLQNQIRDFDNQVAANPANVDTIRAQRDALVRQFSVAYERFQQLAALGPPSSGLAVVNTVIPVHQVKEGFKAPAGRGARVAIAILLALAVALPLIVVLHRLDLRIHDKEDAEAAFGFPVIAEIPPLPRKRERSQVMALSHPTSATAEAFRSLRTSLLLMPSQGGTPIATRSILTHGHNGNGNGNGDGDGDGNGVDSYRDVLREPSGTAIMVVSPTPDDGKSTTIANLAVTFAETARSVIVLSCDFRRPTIHRYLDAGDGAGIADVVNSAAGMSSLRRVARKTPVNGVLVVPSGRTTDHPTELFSHSEQLVATARTLGDVVLIDTAPLLVANDAADLVPDVDQIVIVCKAGRTTSDAAKRTSEQLTRLGAPVLGVVLMAAPAPPGRRSYYYRYRYRYYEYGARPEKRRGRKKHTETQPDVVVAAVGADTGSGDSRV